MEKAIRTGLVLAASLLCLGVLDACKKEKTTPGENITKELLQGNWILMAQADTLAKVKLLADGQYWHYDPAYDAEPILKGAWQLDDRGFTAKAPDDGLLPYIQFDGTVSTDPLTITGEYYGVPENSNGAYPFVLKKE